jgi:hypothetical protein
LKDYVENHPIMRMEKNQRKWPCLVDSLKVNAEIVDRLDINPFSVIIVKSTVVETTAVTQLEEFIAHIVASRDM